MIAMPDERLETRTEADDGNPLDGRKAAQEVQDELERLAASDIPFSERAARGLERLRERK